MNEYVLENGISKFSFGDVLEKSLQDSRAVVCACFLQLLTSLLLSDTTGLAQSQPFRRSESGQAEVRAD